MFERYFIDEDGQLVGLTKVGYQLGDGWGKISASYGVILGYPSEVFGPVSVSAPGGYVPSGTDLSEAQRASLRNIISQNADAAAAGNSTARQKINDARAELTLIEHSLANKPSDIDMQSALRTVADFYQTVSTRFGDKALKLSQTYAAQVRGKRIRSVVDAERAFNRRLTRLSQSDRIAIDNAMKSIEYAKLAANLKKISNALGHYGKVNDVVDVVAAIKTALSTENWTPVIIKLEAFVAGKVATALVALAFSIVLSSSIGIVGYAIIMTLVGAMVNDSLVVEANNLIGKVFG